MRDSVNDIGVLVVVAFSIVEVFEVLYMSHVWDVQLRLIFQNLLSHLYQLARSSVFVLIVDLLV